MKMRVFIRFWAAGGLFLLFLAGGCLSLPRSFHAVSYKNQTVFIDRYHSYRVGPLSPDWVLLKKEKKSEPGIAFKNVKNRAFIVTQAVCGKAFEDLSLELLTGHLFADLSRPQKIRQERWHLSGREALYTAARAGLDGVTVQINVAVLKKNKCQFDFWAISRPESGPEVSDDFEGFVRGFEY